jgi:hypothetical protein
MNEEFDKLVPSRPISKLDKVIVEELLADGECYFCPDSLDDTTVNYRIHKMDGDYDVKAHLSCVKKHNIGE